MNKSVDRLFKILLFALVLFFVRHSFAQKLVTPSEMNRVRQSARVLMQSRPGEPEYPRLVTLKGRERISAAAMARVRDRVARQPVKDARALVTGARNALTSLKELSLTLASLYRGKAYVPPGLNYFFLRGGQVSDLQLQQHLQRTGVKVQQVLDIVEITVSFEHASDLYLAVEALLRADSRNRMRIVGFWDSVIRALKDGDRQVELKIQKHGHVSTLRLELESYLQARAFLKNDRRLAYRQQAFAKAFSITEKLYAAHRTRLLRYNAQVAPKMLKQYAAIAASIKNLEAKKNVPSHSGAPTLARANVGLSNNPEGVLCPNWKQVSVDHNMSSADKMRTFIWGLSQPPCHPDRIRSGHLLYKQIFDSYAGFQWSTQPEERVQQALLRSVYLASADYLRARPTAPQNQMCRPEEKVRMYRGVGAMPLVRPFGAKTGVHLAPLFGDQLMTGLMGNGLSDVNNMSLVPNRDLGELSYENQPKMPNLTWDFVEGVPQGWKFVLGLQRSSNSWGDLDKDGIPEEGPAGSLFGGFPPVLLPPGPIAEPIVGNAVSSISVNKPASEEPLIIPPGTVPGSSPVIDESATWLEPGKGWYRLNGQMNRVLTTHTGTSTYSPFLSASFLETMSQGYGPFFIVMDLCPERFLPNLESTGRFAGEEELYVPFYVLPEEITEIRGRECWLARSKPNVHLLPPEEQEKYLNQMTKICAETYDMKPDRIPESVNETSLNWRSYFRNFQAAVETNGLNQNDGQIHAARKTFYNLFSQGLKASPLNPAGELTLARWRDISRNQVRGFYNCHLSQDYLKTVIENIETTKKTIEEYLEHLRKFPDPNGEAAGSRTDGGGANSVVKPMPAKNLEGPAAGINHGLEEPLKPNPFAEDWRIDEIKRLRVLLKQYELSVTTEKKMRAAKCGN